MGKSSGLGQGRIFGTKGLCGEGGGLLFVSVELDSFFSSFCLAELIFGVVG